MVEILTRLTVLRQRPLTVIQRAACAVAADSLAALGRLLPPSKCDTAVQNCVQEMNFQMLYQ